MQNRAFVEAVLAYTQAK
jgi:triacylglycerol lipase